VAVAARVGRRGELRRAAGNRNHRPVVAFQHPLDDGGTDDPAGACDDHRAHGFSYRLTGRVNIAKWLLLRKLAWMMAEVHPTRWLVRPAQGPRTEAK
jgi:hypothetical protein